MNGTTFITDRDSPFFNQNLCTTYYDNLWFITTVSKMVDINANNPWTISPRSRTFDSLGPNSVISSFFFKFPKSFFGFNFGFSTSSSSMSSGPLYGFTGVKLNCFNSSRDIKKMVQLGYAIVIIAVSYLRVTKWLEMFY